MLLHKAFIKQKELNKNMYEAIYCIAAEISISLMYVFVKIKRVALHRNCLLKTHH